jgi:hypothetical protein
VVPVHLLPREVPATIVAHRRASQLLSATFLLTRDVAPRLQRLASTAALCLLIVLKRDLRILHTFYSIGTSHGLLRRLRLLPHQVIAWAQAGSLIEA